jgi:hypothetical protein
MEGVGTGEQMCEEQGLWKSGHFVERQRQRGIGDMEVALALQFGRRFYQGGDTVYFLGKKQVPKAWDWAGEKVNGTVVIVGRDSGALKTTFRNPQFIAQLKRKEGRHFRARYDAPYAFALDKPVPATNEETFLQA